MRRLTLFIILLVLVVSGCTRLMPPKRIPADSRDYVEAINTAWKEQLLSNLVRMRYGEPLTFLELTNIITQYELQRFGEAGYTFSTGRTAGEPKTTTTTTPIRDDAGNITDSIQTTVEQGGLLLGVPKHVLNIKGNLTHALKPNLTYKPIRGENLRKALINPIPLNTVVELLRTKHDPALIFNYCVESINNLRNSTVGGSFEGDRDFTRLVQVISELLPTGGLRVNIEPAGSEITTVTEEPEKETTIKTKGITTKETSKRLKITKKEKPSTMPYLYVSDADTFRNILGLRNDLTKFPLIYGNRPPSTLTKEEKQKKESSGKVEKVEFAEIVIQTRSIMQIFTLLSQCISVPQIHVAQNRARESKREKAEQARLGFSVESSPEKPRDTFVQVKLFDHWFYIKDTNYDAKDTFSSLMTILSFTEPMTTTGPVLTIPSK